MSNRRFGLTGRARGRNQERMPTIIESEPMVTGATHGPTVVNNNNTIMNIVTSDTASIINNNSTTNIFNARASKESDSIQNIIAAALKKRYVPVAVYDAQLGAGCMNGTRVQVLREIENWVMSPRAQQIFWLAGMAGTGKTAIAQTVCSLVHACQEAVLGGSFFCSRSTGSVAQRDARCIIPTLAQLLARQSVEFSEALANELVQDPDILHKQIAVQVKKLLFTPLIALKDSLSPIVFVIDALDECGGELATDGMASDAESHRVVSDILEALVDLSRSPTRLPVKFLVTSRPETHIRDTPVSDIRFANILRLHTVNKEHVIADIYLYICTRLSNSSKLRARFTNDEVEILTRLCDGLFIVAATALQYTLGGGVDGASRRFKTLLNSARDSLSSGAAAPLDSMYALILLDAAQIDEIHTDELPEMLELLASLLSARMALSVMALADLLGIDIDDVRARLSRLHAVVHVPDDDSEPSLRTLHASFGDYMLGRAPRELRISESHGHDVLARGCLRVLTERLHFNVAQTRSSYEPNAAVRPNSITLSLEYACFHWAYHTASAQTPSMYDEAINDVFRSRLLFWLEVFSILGQVWRAAAILFFGASVVSLPELSEFLRDANAFVTSSEGSIERSAPHIYLSALPFTDKGSLVYKTFAPLYTGLVSVKTFGIEPHAGRLVMSLTGHECAVNSVAYSPDGLLMASASQDCTVRLWSTRTGEETTSPLRSGDGAVYSVAFAPSGQSIAAGTHGCVVCIWMLRVVQVRPQRLHGHIGAVRSVAFSPSGLLIASASADRTARIWEAATGHQLYVFIGHTRQINAVLFSPNRTTLASASDDGTIRLWATTGDIVDHVLLSHTSIVLGVSFAPCGTKLVSGCADQTVRLWNLETGMNVASLQIHSNSVQCVQFSPDGQSVVSGSADGKLILWNHPHDPLKASSFVLDGESDLISSVAFSHDGLYIASAVQDHTIRIWDINRGQRVDHPSRAHGTALSVAVSNELIVSGNTTSANAFIGIADHAVCIWDARTGEQRLPPIQGHTNQVLSVAISSDGRLIASGSKDQTVRLWDAKTGKGTSEPLRAHEGCVQTVKLSPDTKWLASGSEDKTVRIWNVKTGQLCLIKPLLCAGSVHSVDFSPNGRLLAAGDSSGLIRLWAVDTWLLVSGPLRATDRRIRSICFLPDGGNIVCGSDEMIIRIWNIHTRQITLILEGHTEPVRSVTVSPNAQFIGSGSEDGTIRIWEASTGELIETLRGHDRWVWSLAFTPDGRSIVSCADDLRICVWEVSEARVKSPKIDHDSFAVVTSATLEGGWLTGSAGELLIWVPATYRQYLPERPCVMNIGQPRISITVDSDGWHRGENWTSCQRQNMSPSAFFNV